ncbi:MAG: aspartate kinase [Bacteroidales bacterium]|uniref:aspartate kinase n=1 Tax=Porphyromonas sp. TaxID=1924944 RepID=UPI0029716E14|nr:aspartate kinase [Porphyromonas sp.]MDD7437633.1 aspartate kinase [Bacteroidales bacterium]MDY3066550.1 aspartate kinase [Porphyromonas sp.]
MIQSNSYSDLVVMKFGGTSVGNAERIRNVAQLISSDKGRKIVVLSAMSGVTNRLVEISQLYYSNNIQVALKKIDELETSYQVAIDELYKKENNKGDAKAFVSGIMNFLRNFKGEYFTDFEERQILAQGEIISVEMMRLHLVEAGLNATKISALDYMITNKHGEPDQALIKEQLLDLLDRYPQQQIFITEGYICRNAYLEIDNLKRGGSDYTASLVGAAIDAREIQIWTDIDGLHNNDPRIVSHTTAVRHLHFDEAAELAYFGAKILHPTCIHPAKMANIPVRLLNSMEPAAEGTMISNRIIEGELKAVAAKDGITVLRILSTRMLLAQGFLRKVFEIFERYQTPVDMVTTSEVAVSLTIDNPNRLEEIISELNKIAHVSIDQDMTIISVVGDMNWKNVGFESKVVEALQNIPVRMISFGGSNYGVSILVRSEDKVESLRLLSHHLFNEEV